MTIFRQQEHNLPYFPADFTFTWPTMDESLYHDIPTLLDVDKEVMPHIPADRRRVVVQAGGACGVWAKRFSQIFDVVYTFEPTPESYHCLQINCPEHNINMMNVAVGDSNDRRVKMGYPEHIGSNTGKENIGGYRVLGDGDVPMITLDSLGLTGVDLLYLDLEGYELFALHGAQETIAGNKPYIVMEDKAPCTKWYGYHVGDCEKFLHPLGYRTLKRWQGGRDVMLVPV